MPLRLAKAVTEPFLSPPEPDDLTRCNFMGSLSRSNTLLPFPCITLRLVQPCKDMTHLKNRGFYCFPCLFVFLIIFQRSGGQRMNRLSLSITATTKAYQHQQMNLKQTLSCKLPSQLPFYASCLDKSLSMFVLEPGRMGGLTLIPPQSNGWWEKL